MTTIQLNLIDEFEAMLREEDRESDQASQLFEQFKQLGLTTLEFNIKERLAKEREIALIWSYEDVLMQCPKLNRIQAWNVLQFVARNHDATVGVNWETIDLIADSLYPEIDETIDTEVQNVQAA